MKSAGGWYYEGIGFYLTTLQNPPGSPRRCPDGTLSVNRAYNNRAAQNDSNHRLTTRFSEYQATIAQGWTGEGVVMCAAP